MARSLVVAFEINLIIRRVVDSYGRIWLLLNCWVIISTKYVGVKKVNGV